MSKEIEVKKCNECESTFKLIYVLEDTSGFAKFCPFCQSELYDESQEDDLDE